MIGFINTIKDREYKLCTAQKFDDLTHSAAVRQLIDDYRDGNAACKQMLPAFLFQGCDPNVLMGKKGSRLAKNLIPTGLFMMDFDHDEQPRATYDKFLASLTKLGMKMEDVALAHITPSGKGLRLVMKCFRELSIEDCQRVVAEAMGVKDYDAVVKDLSRLSFVPKAEDIIFKNNTLLFKSQTLPQTPPQPSPQGEGEGKVSFANGLGAASVESDFKTCVRLVPDDLRSWAASVESDFKTPPPVGRLGGVFPTSYVFGGCSIPYTRIVQELILLHGGTPNIGNRNNMLFRLVSDLAHITDHSAAWLEQIVPDFGLPEQEWRDCIRQHSQKSKDRGWSRKLTEALNRCKQEIQMLQSDDPSLTDADRVEKGMIPPPMPDKLPPIIALLTKNVMAFQRPATSLAVFPALAAHVSNALFQLADGSDTELSLMCVLLGQQSVGKSCINKPLKYIMADIEEQDEINRIREREWADKTQTKKANEKGEAKPKDLVIRYLGADTTPAAFLGRLYAAERAGYNLPKDFPNYCCYSQVSEIEDMYNFCSRQRNQVTQMIRHSFDRDTISSERWTANAANFKTILRWNWCASSTFENGKRFFQKCLTDGTTSRIDFAVMLPPAADFEFRYGTYDEAFADELDVFINRLTKFECLRDRRGGIIPASVTEIMDLEREMNDYIRDVAIDEQDDIYRNYAWRAKVNAVKRAYVLWIANDCKWSEDIAEFTWWQFKYAMWCKMQLFADKAHEQFLEGMFVPKSRGHRSPLKLMRSQVFTYAEFAEACREMQCLNPPANILCTARNRGLVIQEGDRYVLSPKFCQKNGIPLAKEK